jgi:hypothetical protein
MGADQGLSTEIEVILRCGGSDLPGAELKEYEDRKTQGRGKQKKCGGSNRER